MNIKEILKQLKSVHLLAIGFIILFNLIYFLPQLEGKKVKAHDAISSTAWSNDIIKYHKETGERPQWNSSMFSGMPWGQLSNGFEYNFTRFFNNLSHVYFSYPVGYMIKAGLLTYLALILLGISPFLSIILALAFTYNVNYIILIEAGHANKLEVLAGFPLIISGLILGYRGKLIPSFLAIGFSISIAFLRNHPQMVYYLLMLLFVFAFVYFIHSIFTKKALQFFKLSTIIFIAFAIGAAANLTQILSSKDTSEGTMRGKPILEVEQNQTAAKTSSNVNGLDWKYAMGWSFSKEDIMGVVIPRAVGGGSKEEIGKAIRGENSLANALKSDSRFKPKKDGNYVYNTYFGKMLMTNGPGYLGAAVIFLFIFSISLMSWKNRLAFGITTFFLLLLSMGKNFEILNHFLFDNLPFFNKFRAPSSIISVLPSFVIVGIGIGLNKLFKSENKSQFLKPLLISGAVTTATLIGFYIYLMNFYDLINEGQQILVDTRKSMLSADTKRSVIIVILAFGIFYFFIKSKIKANLLFIGLGLITLTDLVFVGKRYLDADNFVNTSKYKREFTPRPVDKQIFEIESKGRPYYRVFDQSINTFNDAKTSFHHNTIGGYHPAKLQRYQDLIEYHISKGNMEVLNMLNTKYFINQKQQLQVNNQANGVAWFVKELIEVKTPNQEIKELEGLPTKDKAVILANEFNNEDFDNVGDGVGNVKLDSYLPNKLIYSINNSTDQFAVFSEMWYGKNKSWRVYIDGKEANIVRVNYVLRGLEVPANSKQIEFVLDPPLKYAYVSGLFSTILLILLLLTFVLPKKYTDKLNFESQDI